MIHLLQFATSKSCEIHLNNMDQLHSHRRTWKIFAYIDFALFDPFQIYENIILMIIYTSFLTLVIKVIFDLPLNLFVFVASYSNSFELPTLNPKVGFGFGSSLRKRIWIQIHMDPIQI